MHPDGGEVQVMPGKYGPYVKWGKVNATLPKELKPEAVTLEEALALIAEKAGKGGKARRSPPRKTAARPGRATKTASRQRKPAAKKPAAKKPAAKKAPAKTAAKAADG